MVNRALASLMALAGYDRISAPDVAVREITEDSREVKQGWLFVAIRGTNLDGREYVADAISRGAAAIIAEDEIETSVPMIKVPNARQALADISAAFHDYPSRKLRCFGVTGTDGKTTTCYFLNSILQAAGYHPGLLSTVETIIGRDVSGSQGRLTTQSASHLQRMLAQMVTGGNDCAVIEASSHALEQGRLRNVSLTAATITNIGEDHIEFHGSREQYARAKWSLMDLIEPGENPRVILNADDEWSMRLRPQLDRPSLTFAMKNPADVMAREGTSHEIVLAWDGRTVSCFLPRGGRHNMYNASAAAGLAVSIGIDLATVGRGLEKARMPAGRLEPITAGQSFDVFVDYAHTEQAFGATLSYLQEQAKDRGATLIAVFGAAGNRDRAKRPRLAEMAAAMCRAFIITNEDPFGEDADTIIDEIQQGAPATAKNSQWFIEPDRREAMERAFAMAEPGDIVAITGKGHERSIAVGNKALPWNDVEIAREILSRDLLAETGQT